MVVVEGGGVNLLEVPDTSRVSQIQSGCFVKELRSIAMQFEQNGTNLSKPFSIPGIPK